jgi:hypothetical protein
MTPLDRATKIQADHEADLRATKYLKYICVVIIFLGYLMSHAETMAYFTIALVALCVGEV